MASALCARGGSSSSSMPACYSASCKCKRGSRPPLLVADAASATGRCARAPYQCLLDLRPEPSRATGLWRQQSRPKLAQYEWCRKTIRTHLFNINKSQFWADLSNTQIQFICRPFNIDLDDHNIVSYLSITGRRTSRTTDTIFIVRQIQVQQMPRLYSL